MLDLDLLNDKLIGKSFLEDVIYFEQIDSTNAYAKRNDVGNNSLVVAEFQSAGRGRVDRQWESANAENLTFTIKKKFDLEPGKHQVINFYFSYFLLAAVESFMSKQTPADFRCEIKWPNDIILNGRKLAGMLIERYASGNFFVGVGLNVNQRSFNPGYPMEPISIATVLRAPLDRTNLLIHILYAFSRNLPMILTKKYDKIYEQWIRSCSTIGKNIEAILPESENIRGMVTNVLPDGGILIRTGEAEKVLYAGDIRTRII